MTTQLEQQILEAYVKEAFGGKTANASLPVSCYCLDLTHPGLHEYRKKQTEENEIEGLSTALFFKFAPKFLRFRGSPSFLNTCLWINYNCVEFFYSSIHCWLSDMAQGCTPWVKREPLNLLCSVLYVNVILLKEVVHHPTQESVLTPLESLRLCWSIRWRRAIFKPWSNNALVPWITCRNMA